MKEKTKKTLSILFLICMLSVGALAIWNITVGKTITGNVISDPEGAMYWSVEITDIGTIDTTNSSKIVNTTGIIQNDNGLITALFTNTINKTDINDGCVDYENDVNITFYFNDVEVNSNDQVNVEPGSNTYNIITTYARSSCPQNLTIESLFTEVIV